MELNWWNGLGVGWCLGIVFVYLARWVIDPESRLWRRKR